MRKRTHEFPFVDSALRLIKMRGANRRISEAVHTFWRFSSTNGRWHMFFVPGLVEPACGEDESRTNSKCRQSPDQPFLFLFFLPCFFFPCGWCCTRLSKNGFPLDEFSPHGLFECTKQSSSMVSFIFLSGSGFLEQRYGKWLWPRMGRKPRGF